MDTHLTVPKTLDSSAVRGVALMVLGITAIAFPFAASITAAYIVGWVLIVASVTHFVLAWTTRRESWQWTALAGVLYGLAGMGVLRNPWWGAISMAIALGVVLLLGGVLSVIVYFIVEHTSKWVLFNGVVFLALAIVIASGGMANSLWLIGTLAGINLLVRGTAGLAAWIDDDRLSHRRAL
jgi:uncharacterized membrane protein HdeD (DUF308 family)